MKCIVLFGAGKSSSVLIDYLKAVATQNEWRVFVADHDLASASQKTGQHHFVQPVQVDVYNHEQRSSLVKKADVVISLLPPAFHTLVATDCILFGKHLLTASYIDDTIKALQHDIKDKGLLFLCEMGLDPGIDHMSAMQLIHRIQEQDGVITSFKSHCGGLIAPESDDNPWHYKISWNPRNVVMAGKAGAVYKENGRRVAKVYEELFMIDHMVDIPTLGLYSYYPNRDSLGYAKLYQLENAHTFIRTTLRHPEFCIGWKNLIDLKFTEENIFYHTDNMTIADFFQEHYGKVKFEEWMDETLERGVQIADKITEHLTSLKITEEETEKEGREKETDFMMVDDKGSLVSVNVEHEKENAEALADFFRHKAAVSLQQLFFLGLEDKETFINKGTCSVAEILQFIIERKLALQPHDKDMVVMMHEIEYTLHNKPEKIMSYLIVKGEDNTHTAMAKTVGLPLGIAAKLLLEGKIQETGLHIPIIPSVYGPVLAELAQHGISFTEVK